MIFLENSTLEIHPVPKRLRYRLGTREALLEDSSEKYPHIIRRASSNPVGDFSATLTLPEEYNGMLRTAGIKARRIGRLTVEVALFFDEVGYKIFAPYFDYDTHKIRDMLLAYLNGVSNYR